MNILDNVHHMNILDNVHPAFIRDLKTNISENINVLEAFHPAASNLNSYKFNIDYFSIFLIIGLVLLFFYIFKKYYK
jgi:hypothetical protein